MNRPTKFQTVLVLGAMMFGSAGLATAQYVSVEATAPPVAGIDPDQTILNDEQLQDLLAPVALYPDPLLAQLLPASTYPLQIVAAERWIQGNASPTEAAIDSQQLEPPVQAMMHYPTVLQMMNDRLDWTQSLGVAFINQQADVMNVIQELRQQALTAGALVSTPQQQVIEDEDGIQIVPVDPNLIYVPQYDPAVIYDGGVTLTFGNGFAAGIWLNNGFDWHNHWIATDEGWNHGWDRFHAPHPNGRDWPQTKAWSRDRGQPVPIRTHPPQPIRHAPIVAHPGYADPKVPARPDHPNAFGGYQQHADVQRAQDRGRESHPAPPPAPSRAPAPPPHEAEPSHQAAPPHPAPPPHEAAPARPAQQSPPPQAFHPAEDAHAAAAASARGHESQGNNNDHGGDAKKK